MTSNNSKNYSNFFFKLSSGYLLIILYELTMFEAPIYISFWNTIMLTLWKGHNSIIQKFGKRYILMKNSYKSMKF